jgi:hypothetical protein
LRGTGWAEGRRCVTGRGTGSLTGGHTGRSLSSHDDDVLGLMELVVGRLIRADGQGAAARGAKLARAGQRRAGRLPIGHDRWLRPGAGGTGLRHGPQGYGRGRPSSAESAARPRRVTSRQSGGVLRGHWVVCLMLGRERTAGATALLRIEGLWCRKHGVRRMVRVPRTPQGTPYRKGALLQLKVPPHLSQAGPSLW